MQNILIIVGSLAKQSVNRTIAQYIADKYRDQFHFTFAEIGDLPLYTQDRDVDSPASYQRLRENAWNGKAIAIITVSPSFAGGMAANHALRTPFTVLNGAVMPSPETYFGSIHQSLNEQGELVGEHVTNTIEKFMQSFKQWIARFA